MQIKFQFEYFPIPAVFNLQYDCDFCSEKFDNQTIRQAHILEHFERKNCLDCNKNLIRIGNEWYELHLTVNCTKIKHENEDSLNTIVECVLKEEESYFCLENNVKTEEEDIDCDVFPENVDKGNATLSESLADTNKPAQTAKSRKTLRKTNKEKLFKCYFPGCSKEVVKKSSLKEHMSTHTGSMRYECNICGKRYPYSASLRNHIKAHAKVKFKCAYCKRTFDANEELQKHLIIHGDQVLLTCDICNESFKDDARLKKHSERHMEKICKCTVVGCEKMFSIQAKLEEHMNVHNGVKKYVCRICGNRYPYKASLHNHIQTHKLEKFKCVYCVKVFYSENELVEHIMIHNFDTFSCDICQAQFKKYSLIKQHMKNHSQGKIYKCTFADCAKAFAKESTWREHSNAHKGIKKYQCEICGMYEHFIRQKYK